MKDSGTVDSSSIIRRSPDAVYRVVDGEAVVVEPQKGMVNVLNAVGSTIWQHADGKRSISEIAGIVAAEYGADGDTALKDALEFVEDMRSKGLMICECLPIHSSEDV